MRWIRLQGVIAFLVVAALAAVFWFLLIDSIVKRQIEKTGTAIVGAKVELNSADLTLFPLGLTLTGLQVTNPDSPMRNAFEVEKVSFLMDGMNILRRKVIIDEMTVQGVRLNTLRKTSGAVSRAEKEAARAGALIRFELPDIDEVLEKEKLESLKIITGLRAEIEADTEKYNALLRSLIEEDKVKEFRARLERLKTGGRDLPGALGKADEALKLSNEIRAEVDRLTRLTSEATGKAGSYQRRVSDALKAPMRDINRIKEKYAFTPEGFSNMGRIFLEGALIEWTDKLLRWKARVEPIVKAYSEGGEEVKVEKPIRGKGADVRFREYAPLPDFLIRKAAVSITVPAGDISGVVENITPDQDILGSPLRFAFAGERLKGLDSMSLSGEVNRVVPGSPADSLAFDVKGLKVNGLTMGGSLPFELRSGLTDVSLKAAIRGEALKADIGAKLTSLDLAMPTADGSNTVLRAVASAVEEIKGFSLRAEVKGTLKGYDVSLKTDLDDILKSSATRVFAKEAARFEARLKEEVLKKTGVETEGLKSGYSGLEILVAELGKRLDLTKGLLTETKKGSPLPFKLPQLF